MGYSGAVQLLAQTVRVPPPSGRSGQKWHVNERAQQDAEALVEPSNNQTAEGVVCFFSSASCSASDPGGPGGEMSKLPDKETSGGGGPEVENFFLLLKSKEESIVSAL